MQSTTPSIQTHMLAPFLKLLLLPIFQVRKLKLRKVNNLLKVTELGIKPRSAQFQSYVHINSMNILLIKIIINSTTVIIIPFIWKNDFPPFTHWILTTGPQGSEQIYHVPTPYRWEIKRLVQGHIPRKRTLRGQKAHSYIQQLWPKSSICKPK